MGADGSLLDLEEVTRGSQENLPGVEGSARLVLVLFDPAGVREIEVPTDRTLPLNVGRASTCDIHIEHPSVSRAHARLRRGPSDTIIVEDLESSNGTFANEMPVGEDALPVGIGENVRFGYVYARLTVASPARYERQRVIGPSELDAAVTLECERCLRHGGSVAVVAVEVPRGWPTLADSVAAVIPHGDVVTLRRPGQCEVLLVGRTKDQALETADRIRDALAARERGVRLGVAAFPGDATSATTLTAAALMAMRSAGEGTVRAARSASRILRCDGQEVVASDPATLRILGELERVAPLACDVLLLGEEGTGKELHARLLHSLGPRAALPFVHVDCQGVTPDSLVGQLFGSSGAVEKAAGSTLYLEEVTALPISIQDQLLELLGAGTGASIADARLVASTAVDFRQALRDKKIRRPLHDRLVSTMFALPPLRERRGELLLLAQRFIAGLARQAGMKPVPLSGEAASALARHGWPGNIDELREVLSRALAACDGDLLRSTDFGVGAEDGLLTSARRLQDLRDEPTVQMALPTDEELAKHRK